MAKETGTAVVGCDPVSFSMIHAKIWNEKAKSNCQGLGRVTAIPGSRTGLPE